jgi:hypothetical protein
MRQRGVKVVDGFDADDAEFQAVLVRVDVGVWMDGWVWLAEMSCSAVVVVGRSERRELKSVWLNGDAETNREVAFKELGSWAEGIVSMHRRGFLQFCDPVVIA